MTRERVALAERCVLLLDLLQKRKKAKGPTQLSKFFKGADASDSSDSGKGLAPTLTLALRGKPHSDTS
jgi:hypothetical protein